MKKYDELLEVYLSEGINYDANTISKAERGDLEQLAADSYWQGWQDCKANGVEQSTEEALHKHIVNAPLLPVRLICKNCNGWFGININHKCFKCLDNNFVDLNRNGC